MNPELYFKTRDEWHEWLLENHDKCNEAWLLYYKKYTKIPTISYEDAVLEALSFGWIDGKVMSIDAKRYKQRFTPRRKNSFWSETNYNRVKMLIKEGRMNQAGLEAAKGILSGKTKIEPGISQDIPMPKSLEIKLREDKLAWDNFSNFPPSIKKIFYYWIEGAKRDETKAKRIQKSFQAAKDNNKMGYM